VQGLPFLKLSNKQGEKEDKNIQFELPYFITLVTLFAASGFAPYTIFKKIRDIEILPHVREESEKIIRRIDNLGLDPLVVMSQVKEKSKSKSLGEFLNGYVSAIQGGGDVLNYLKSKMDNVFEVFANAQKEIVEKARAIVEAYMTIQVVILAVYIIITATTTTVDPTSSFDPLYLMVVLPLIVTVGFLAVAHKMSKSRTSEINFKKAVMFGAPAVLITALLAFLGVFPEYSVYMLAVGLIAASVWPFISFQKIQSFSLDAENATPQILRDIAEVRKAGLGPEKCVIKACKRKDYGRFNGVANAIATKLEWGIPLEDIYQSLKKEIKNFQILVSFRILFEIISSGGGNVNTLQTLAAVSEKIQTIEKSKREALKPYVMVGFMLIGITGFTTLLVIDSLASINMQSITDETKKAAMEVQAKSRLDLLSFSVVVQAWMAGLFLGKLTTGSYSGGFKLSILLIIISIVAIIIVQQPALDIGNMFNNTKSTVPPILVP
jgi:flagellar protein FlaJ